MEEVSLYKLLPVAFFSSSKQFSTEKSLSPVVHAAASLVVLQTLFSPEPTDVMNRLGNLYIWQSVDTRCFIGTLQLQGILGIPRPSQLP
jgi:hypothetical protein